MDGFPRLTTEATYGWIPPSDDGGHVSMVASIVRSWSNRAVHELPKTLARDRRRVGRRRRYVDPCNRRRSFCVAASRRGRGRRGS